MVAKFKTDTRDMLVKVRTLSCIATTMHYAHDSRWGSIEIIATIEGVMTQCGLPNVINCRACAQEMKDCLIFLVVSATFAEVFIRDAQPLSMPVYRVVSGFHVG